MPFHNRKWCVVDIPDAETLADKLKGVTSWALCTGFRLNGYLFLNDSTCEDGAQEYAIIQESTGVQIEGVTFGWMSRAETIADIQAIVAGKYDGGVYGRIVPAQIQTPEQHGRCCYCA